MGFSRLALLIFTDLILVQPVDAVEGSEVLSLVGRWKNEDATFKIFENSGKRSAKIVALRNQKHRRVKIKKCPQSGSHEA